MDRPWLKLYPKNVPADIEELKWKSVPDALDEAVRRHGDKPAAKFLGGTVSYRRIFEDSVALSTWLQSRGLVKGTRVAIMMTNAPQYLVALMGVLRAGGVIVNVNPLYTARELEHQLRDSGAEFILILENFAHTLAQIVGKTSVREVIVTSMGDGIAGPKSMLVDFVVRRVKKLVPAFSLPRSIRWKQVMAEGRRATMKPVPLELEDLAFLQFTGGTTGVAKGAMLTHRNMLSNLVQTIDWHKAIEEEPVEQVMVCALPMYHIFALLVSGLFGMHMGAKIILIPNPRDLAAVVKELKGEKMTYFPAVNTLFNALSLYPDFAKLDFSRLRNSVGGGMSVLASTAERWKKITGAPIVEGYGLSETSPVLSCNIANLGEYNGSIGLPYPSTFIRLLDDAGNDVPPGTPGEVCAKGPQVMKGYWNQPEETRKAFTADGYFKTGDIGMFDEAGLLRLVDRKKDMILVSGFNVYPNEVESVVSSMPGVLECAAVGVPDARSGEAVKLVVVKRDPALTEQQILDHCHENLTGYKRPRHIEFRTDLPKTNVGKVLRRELR